MDKDVSNWSDLVADLALGCHDSKTPPEVHFTFSYSMILWIKIVLIPVWYEPNSHYWIFTLFWSVWFLISMVLLTSGQ